MLCYCSYIKLYLRGNYSNLELVNFFAIQVFMCQKTENLDFGHEGVFWSIFGLGKSCRAFKNTFKNFFLIEKIWLLAQLMVKNV